MAAATNDSANRTSRMPTDRTISNKIEALAPDAKLYRGLQDVEIRVDATIARKRLDLQDSLSRSMKNKKTMRIFVSNTAKDQPWQSSNRLEENAYDFETDAVPHWTLRIEGRLLTDEPEVDGRRFSSFMRSIIVEIDRPNDLYYDSNYVEWHRGQGTSQFDGLEVTRKGDFNVDVKITLVADEYPDRYKLSPPLADLLNLAEATRPGIVMALWQYIKFHKLQDTDERRLVHCDAALRQVFNAERILFPDLPELINTHLRPTESVSFVYNVRVDKDSHKSETAYDIEVEIDDPIRKKMQAILYEMQFHEKISVLDEKLVLAIQAINAAKAKRDFFTSFEYNPSEAINRWVASQSRDLQVILGDRDIVAEDVRRSDFYNQPWINENVFLLLNRRGTAQ